VFPLIIFVDWIDPPLSGQDYPQGTSCLGAINRFLALDPI